MLVNTLSDHGLVLVESCSTHFRIVLLLTYFRGFYNVAAKVTSIMIKKGCITDMLTSVFYVYNICISNAQNCELSAPGNLWCEIREFWACSFILLIHSVLCGSERKCAGFSTAKVAFSFAVEPLLHPHTSTFARQYCHYCLTIQPQSYRLSGAIALLDGCGHCENAEKWLLKSL